MPHPAKRQRDMAPHNDIRNEFRYMEIAVRTELLELLLNVRFDTDWGWLYVKVLVSPGTTLWLLWLPDSPELPLWYISYEKRDIIRGWCAEIIQKAWRRRRSPLWKARAALVAAASAIEDHCLSGGALALPREVLDDILRLTMRLTVAG